MNISGKITFTPPISDASNLTITLSPEDDQQGLFFSIPLNKDGTFSEENERFNAFKILYLAVQKDNEVLKKCGFFNQKEWGNIIITDVPYRNDEEPVEENRLIKLSGYLVDELNQEPNFDGYKVTLAYQLSNEQSFKVSNTISNGALLDGTFQFDVLLEIPGALKVNEQDTLIFSVTDVSGNQIPCDIYLVKGQTKTKIQQPTFSDLDNERLGRLTDIKKLASRTYFEKLTLPETTKIELRYRSSAPAQLPVTVKERPLQNASQKLRGRVVDKSGKLSLRNNQVIIYASGVKNTAGESPQQVVGVSVTDAQGNFSIAYPMGMFTVAYATVSVKPDEVKDIVLNETGEFPDFVWLIMETLPEDMTQDKHDDCACKNTTPALPDMEELLSNTAYSQDVGGSCTNFTTPNRALEEFVYKTVVRTSDPELFNLDETTLREQISSINARINSINQQLNGFSYVANQPINFKPLLITVQPADTPSKDDISVKQLSGQSVSLKTTVQTHLSYTQPVKDFFRNNLNNENARLLRIELAYLQKELQKTNRLLSYKGRIPLDGKNPIDWDDSDNTLGVVQASTIAFGHILNYKQVWRAAGYSLGDLLYSLPLAPGQKKQIAVYDWDRKESASREESLDYNDSLENSMSHARDISEIVNSNLAENTSASSHNKSKGSSMGIGAGTGTAGSGAGAGSFSGFSVIGAATAMLGISGGANKSSGESWSDASQNSMRNLSASTNQNLRESTMQNASSLRSQRSSVVTTVSQGESFSITTEVVANHNHCHAVTIQYFEVLRHYAIHQELSDVQECLFIPMFIDSFDRRKILRWRDVLSTYLFAPSDKIRNLHAGFDALQRAADDDKGDPDAYADFPTGRYCDESLTDLFGDMKFNLHVVRPASTVVSSTEAPPTLEQRKQALIDSFMNGNLAWIPGIKEMAERLVNGLEEKIEENFQKELLWAQMPEEYTKFFKISVSLKNSNGLIDLGTDISLISKKDIGQNSQDPANSRHGIFEMVISIRPTSTTINRLIGISREDIQSVIIINIQNLPVGSSCLLLSGSVHYRTEHYAGSLFRNTYISNDVANGDSAYISTPLTKDELRNPLREDRKNADLLIQHLNTNREHYHTKLWLLLDEQRLFNLLDKYSINVPKLRYATGTKDGEEVYGLVLDESGNPVIDYETRSVASVVELRRVGMAGNSIIFPVARGMNLNKDYLLIPQFSRVDEVDIPVSFANTTKIRYFGESNIAKNYSKIGLITGETKVDLIDLYKPLPGSTQEPKPFRVSVPTKGLFAEAVAGSCNSCEKIDDSRFWKWEEHPIDEPTAIQPISTDSRRTEPGDLTAKDFAAPMINIQAAPAAPDPQGLANALMLMGKSDIFKDITGLDQTQKNALQAMLSNQDAAKYFADQAAKLAIEAGKNTQHAADTVANYDLAKRNQKMQALDKIQDLPLDSDTKQKYYDEAMGEILGNDGKVGDALGNALKDNGNQDNLTDKEAINQLAKNNDVAVSRTTPNGTETVNIKGRGNTGSAGDTDNENPANPDTGSGSTLLADAGGLVPLMKQENDNACWATAATMMMSWKQAQSLTIEEILTQAGDEYLDKFTARQGLFATEKNAFIGALGMVAEQSGTNYELQTYINLLKTYGPLWITTDSQTANGKFSPHARVLTKITGTGAADVNGTQFTFNDPLTGTEKTETFKAFLSAFEQMATDNTGTLFIQIVHFDDKRADGGDGSEGGDKDAAADLRNFVPLNENTLIINKVELTPTEGLVLKNWKNKGVHHYHTPKIPALMVLDDIKKIILHESAAVGIPVADESTNSSAHMSVNMGGDIYQNNDLCERMNHANEYSRNSIGIEFENKVWDDKPTSSLARDKNERIVVQWQNPGFNDTKPNYLTLPTQQQLESLITVVKMIVINTSVPFIWPQLITYPGNDHPEYENRGPNPSFFVLYNAPSLFSPDNPGFYSHRCISTGKMPGHINPHSDGTIQSIYTFLRLGRQMDPNDAYTNMRSMLMSVLDPVTKKYTNPNLIKVTLPEWPGQIWLLDLLQYLI